MKRSSAIKLQPRLPKYVYGGQVLDAFFCQSFWQKAKNLLVIIDQLKIHRIMLPVNFGDFYFHLIP